jgi:hypothetical protein
MFFIFLLSVGCAIWAIHPNMGYPALLGLITIQLGAITMTCVVTRNKRRDERLGQLQAELYDAQAQLAMLSADKLFEGKIISVRTPRGVWPFNS